METIRNGKLMFSAADVPPAGFRSPTGALPAQTLLESLAGQMVGKGQASGLRDALRQLRESQPSAWAAATKGMATTPESVNDRDFVKALRAVWKEEAPRDPRTGQIAASIDPGKALEERVKEVWRERKTANFVEAAAIVETEEPELYREGMQVLDGRKKGTRMRVSSTDRQRQQLRAEIDRRVATGKAQNFAVALSQIKDEGDVLYQSVAADYAAPKDSE